MKIRPQIHKPLGKIEKANTKQTLIKRNSESETWASVDEYKVGIGQRSFVGNDLSWFNRFFS